jgi:parallel beta-helix repeat protein
MRRLLFVAAVSAACFGVFQVGGAQAAAPCGTITASTTLAADCDAPLTIGASGITVDLGGHSVLCSGGTGIDVNSQDNVRVQNGSVSGCVTGVFGDGADSNVFAGLTLADNDVGFDLRALTASTIQHNEVTNSSATGILLFQSSGNVVKRNTVLDSGVFGIFDNGGTNNLIVSNTAAFAVFDGIAVLAQSDVVVGNSTSDNATGIHVVGADGGNRLFGNKSLDNGLDMKDDAPDCDANVWKGNKFVTADPSSCIH